MNKSEKLVFARALAETFTDKEIKDMRKKCLTAGVNGKVTSWSDIGLSTSMTYDFNLITAVDILTAALDILNGVCVGKKEKIKKFVL